jgi:hypothetical protein
LALPVEPLEIDDRVMHIGGRHMGVGDDGILFRNSTLPRTSVECAAATVCSKGTVRSSRGYQLSLRNEARPEAAGQADRIKCMGEYV